MKASPRVPRLPIVIAKEGIRIIFQSLSTRKNAPDLSGSSEQAHFSYTIACKLQWLGCLLVCVLYICASIEDVHLALTRFHGWQLAAAIALGLLLLKYVAAAGIFVVRRLFVWSTYALDNQQLTQHCFGKTVVIELCEPYKISYQFLFKECDHLDKPFYQCMVIRQGGKTLRILPYHLKQTLNAMLLPKDIRDAWQLYDGKHPWFVGPTWLKKR